MALISDLVDAQLNVPLLEIVNPPLWEIGHIAFFYEVFVLHELENAKPIIAGAGDLYNSFEVDHDDRWALKLPDRIASFEYMETVLNRLIDRLGSREPDAKETYLYLLGIFHEDMHIEALTYTRQTLGYGMPNLPNANSLNNNEANAGSLPGDAEIPGGTFMFGAARDYDFVFDNEKWEHEVEIKPFRIARAPVTNAEFAGFVNAGGYEDSKYWSYGGGVWLSKSKAKHPVYWKLDGNQWLQKKFDAYIPIKNDEPVIHVNWYEAEAYCNWAGRRLPTEAEWELAASVAPVNNESGINARKRLFPWGDEADFAERANLDAGLMGCADVGAFQSGDNAFGCRQMIGNVWEWTSAPFYPFPGFIIDSPYKEYSAPWFGYRKTLRGGSWATSSRMIRNTYRNFFLPYRSDIFAGFRTCAK